MPSSEGMRTPSTEYEIGHESEEDPVLQHIRQSVRRLDEERERLIKLHNHMVAEEAARRASQENRIDAAHPIEQYLRELTTAVSSPALQPNGMAKIPPEISLNCALESIPQIFRPNKRVLEQMGISTGRSVARLPGDNHQHSLGSQPTVPARPLLPDNENCALFLTGIPPQAIPKDVFRVINTGAVYCLHVNPPTAAHPTMAAKLVFMIPEAAAAFLSQIYSPNGIIVQGQRIRGRYNRSGYERHRKQWQSRVLLIEGPRKLMTFQYWVDLFQKFSVFELEDVFSIDIPSNPDRKVMQFLFARVDGQAQTCLQAIQADITLKGVVKVNYGADPCGLPFTQPRGMLPGGSGLGSPISGPAPLR